MTDVMSRFDRQGLNEEPHYMERMPLRCQVCRLGSVSLPDECPFHEMRRPAGSVILHQGTQPESVWYLRRGQVALRSVGENGREQACAVRGPETLLGLEVIDGQVVPYEVSALSDVVLCALDAQAFRSWLGGLDTPLGAVLNLSLREAAARVAERDALEGAAVTRVSRFLVQQHSADSTEEAVGIPQRVLARVLGMRPETLSRALAELRRARALAPGRCVRVVDVSALRAFAEQQP